VGRCLKQLIQFCFQWKWNSRHFTETLWEVCCNFELHERLALYFYTDVYKLNTFSISWVITFEFTVYYLGCWEVVCELAGNCDLPDDAIGGNLVDYRWGPDILRHSSVLASKLRDATTKQCIKTFISHLVLLFNSTLNVVRSIVK
jgi:hypothetical protein